GRAREHQQVHELERPIALDLEVAGRPVRVELVGTTEPMNQAAGSLTLIAGSVHDRHRLRGFFDHLLVAAAGDAPPGRAVLVPGHGGCKRLRLRPLDAAEARGYLAALATDLLGERHAYLLPCEAVFGHLGDRERSPSAEARKLVRGGRWFSSRGGPVDRIEEIEPLPDDQARAVIERRFGLFARTVEVERG
ncbi:MAG TPA: hypothetical protein VL172_18085, partial [Kofleriaceae bacterium]|nr:hypothetical protein [Kofleriaceae bacterium]